MRLRRSRAGDFRGLLALLSLGAVFAYAGVLLLVTDCTTDLPPWMAALSALVIGHYFGATNSAHRHELADGNGNGDQGAEPHPVRTKKEATLPTPDPLDGGL